MLLFHLISLFCLKLTIPKFKIIGLAFSQYLQYRSEVSVSKKFKIQLLHTYSNILLEAMRCNQCNPLTSPCFYNARGKAKLEHFQQRSKQGKFLENPKVFPIANYSPKMSKIPGRKSNGTEISGKKFSKILVFLASLPASFAEILENAFPFTTENFRNLGLESLCQVGIVYQYPGRV